MDRPVLLNGKNEDVKGSKAVTPPLVVNGMQQMAFIIDF